MMSEEEKRLFIGKKIKDIYIDGFIVNIILEDDIKLEYNASDGGYSTYNIIGGM